LETVVIRSARMEEAAEDDEFLAEATEEGVFAFLNVCTHFCCIPGFKISETAERAGRGDQVFCQCHQSFYDPFSILEQTFVSFPQPDDVQEPEGGGGGGEEEGEEGGGEEAEGEEAGGEDEEGGGEGAEGEEGGGGEEEETEGEEAAGDEGAEGDTGGEGDGGGEGQ
ncbi:MAG: Rieske 2Fe-2S domain-containing protein, partial [Halalkalicoccus sp.]